jgi:cyanophycinase
VAGNGEQTHRLDEAIKLAPGFGFINGVVIDQHFAERGRIGRRLGVIAQNPKNIGLGIDENTAIVVEGERSFYVLGDGAVYVIDCRDVSDSNIVDAALEKTLAVCNVKFHLLSEGYSFDLNERQPKRLSRAAAQQKLPQTKAKEAQSKEEGA